MNAATCNADDDGRRCHRNAVMLRPVALCHAHRIEIALTVVPELLRDQLATALQDAATGPAVRSDLIATARPAKLDALLHGVHDSVVYFIANGGRVKIGYTTNLKSRLGSLALRADAVLLALHGGPELERALHQRFDQYRNGNTEWFELSPEIFRYAANREAPPARRSTGKAPRAQRKAEALAQSIERARGWLATEPDLTGTQVGARLGTGDSYGRRVLRAAKGGGYN